MKIRIDMHAQQSYDAIKCLNSYSNRHLERKKNSSELKLFKTSVQPGEVGATQCGAGEAERIHHIRPSCKLVTTLWQEPRTISMVLQTQCWGTMPLQKF